MDYSHITTVLGDEAGYLLNYASPLSMKDHLKTPSWKAVEDTFLQSDRSPEVLANIRRLYHTGRLAGSGYLSIFPVDQAIEHTAAYSFYKNPTFFNPESIIRFAYESGCSAVASTRGVLGLFAQSYAHKIPFILKVNHNELLTYPTKYDQIMFASVEQAVAMQAVAVGATVYFGSPESNRQLVEVARLFEEAHKAGLATILWCYPRNAHFEQEGKNYESAVDVSSQAIHLGVTIGADIVKQKLPTADRAFEALHFGKYDQEMYTALLTDHPIDLVRYQVLHAYAGRIPLISSGGQSEGSKDEDFRSAIKTAIINKRAGGSGLIMGRKLFNHSWEDGKAILQAVQDVYLEEQITLA